MKWVFLFSLTCLFFSQTEGFLKPVSTVLKSKWPNYPIVLEVSEFLHDENPAHFWSFVDSVSQHDVYDTNWSDKKKYDVLVSEAGRYVPKNMLDLLKLSLSLRVYSPKIEMYHHVASQTNYPTNCSTFVDINGVTTCDLTELDKAIVAAHDVGRGELFKFDHVYPGPPLPEGKTRPVAILFGEIGTTEFKLFHHALSELASTGLVDYVVRHYVWKPSHERIRLSGYGVELQIKSTEYKASDDSNILGNVTEDSGRIVQGDEVDGFLFEQLRALYPGETDKYEALKTKLFESLDLTPMEPRLLQDLSIKAVTKILKSSKEDQLKMLSSVSHNFPIHARPLVETKVSQNLRWEMERNQKRFFDLFNFLPGAPSVFLNGQYFDVDSLDVFTLLDAIKSNLRIIHQLQKVGVPASKIKDLLLVKVVDGKDYVLDIRDSAVRYVNDIETEDQYSQLSTSVMDLVRASLMGMMRPIRQNIHHLIFAIDPLDVRARPLVKYAESFLLRDFIVRIGFVFAVNASGEATGENDAGVALLNAFNYIAEKEDARSALSFITEIYSFVGTKNIEVEDIKKVFKSKYRKADYDSIFGQDSEYDVGRKLSKDFLRRGDFKDLPQVLFNGKILDKFNLGHKDFYNIVLTEVIKTTDHLIKAVMKGEVKNGDNILDYFMSQPNVVTRFNNRILRAEQKFIKTDGPTIPKVCSTGLLEINDSYSGASLVEKMTYIRGCKNNSSCPLTLWIVTDLARAEEREALSEYISLAKKSKNLRVGVIHNGNGHQHHLVSVPKLYQTIMDHAPADKVLTLIETIMKLSIAKALESGAKKISEIDGLAEFEAKYNETSERMYCDRLFIDRVLKWNKDARGIIANGRILGPLEPEETLSVSDLELVVKIMLPSAKKINEIIGKFSSQESSDVVFKAHPVLAENTGSEKHDLTGLFTSHSVLHLTAPNSTLPAQSLDVILDPLTPAAQKLSGILLLLKEALNVDIRVFFSCLPEHSQMPLKSFYRFVAEPEIRFTTEGKALPGPAAEFVVPQEIPLLTLNMQVPENWLVEAVESVHDLDNIKVANVEGIHSEFELEHLLLEGQCFEQPSGEPSRGLQLVLGTRKAPNIVDTIVMANLGYFQLKANPGVWTLKLREGRSDNLYDIVGQDSTSTTIKDSRIFVSSFQSHLVKLKVQKKPGKETEDVLGEDLGKDEETGLWNSFTSNFFSKSRSSDKSKNETLNIFSLASGHLYERLLRIMMLSVVKQTNAPVKFWFLKNYLSPAFKHVLPHMAEKYGFQFELVQYKWPRWLHQQTEKQRIIWGYKILFLDVLFPLEVKKIIFVDADQVVRTDLAELRDLDLEGAVYGYTPFCESRKGMENYRFWKKGYWEILLRGKKYHISALYVVDLKKFRKIAAGDRLRRQYQVLSEDPNSLANLDQDLPNSMMDEVPMKSLPQDWLWCETWCDDESKKSAKTIDLCNNPKTKESKLDAAQRIISEWSSYDNEIKELLNDLNGNSTKQSQEREACKRIEL